MRRIIYLLLCILLIFVLTACNSRRNEQNYKLASPSESAESINTSAPMESENSSQSDNPLSGSKPTEVSERPSAGMTPASTVQPSASPAESAPVPTTRPAVSPSPSSSAETADKDTDDDNMISINIAVGSTTFTAKLYDNKTAQALIAQFPMTIQMEELNGQEKYYYLSENLPAAFTQQPSTIHAGDIMLWSGNCLVLFYKTYSNSYGGYVPLGTVDDPSNLASALSSGNVQVTWSLAD